MSNKNTGNYKRMFEDEEHERMQRLGREKEKPMRRLFEASNEVLRVLEAVETQEDLASRSIDQALWAARDELKAALLAEGAEKEQDA